MKQTIIIHGMPDKQEVLENIWPSPSNAHWIPWVQKQLTRKDIICQTPEMPRSYEPEYISWKKVFHQFAISSETVLIGHSCGGGFLLRYLSEHPEITPKQVILVAPWLDPEPHELTTNFFDFKIDEKLPERTRVDCMYSTDDDAYILDSIEIIKNKLSEIHFHVFTDKGHFTEPDLESKEFPELLGVIEKGKE